MQTVAWIAFAMPPAIFLLAGWSLVVRLRLESRGLRVRATVTSYRQWSDDTTHHNVTYRFTAGGEEYTGSGSAPRKCAVGDPVDVLYHAERPAFNQLVAGGAATSTGLTVFVMMAMIAVELWLVSLLPR